MMMTRKEHMQWCKGRALSYVDAGKPQEAISSMMSDLTKHEETRELMKGPLAMIAMWELQRGTPESVREFITGFAE